MLQLVLQQHTLNSINSKGTGNSLAVYNLAYGGFAINTSFNQYSVKAAILNLFTKYFNSLQPGVAYL